MLHLKEPKDVPEQHYALLADILNSAWKDLIVTAHEQIKFRFASGNKFFIVYGEPALVDKEKLAQEYGIALPEESITSSEGITSESNTPSENIPLGLLETIAIKTQGVISRVPKTYAELTHAGNWKPPENGADTIIMVDATKLPTAPSSVTEYMMSAVKDFLLNSQFRYAWTFTPDIEAVKKWHQGFGAKDTQYRIPHARQGWKEPGVNCMDYSHLIKASPLWEEK